MPNSPDRPFDDDTLKLRAVFVPENAKKQASRADIVRTLGHDAVKVPAVFVPEGGKPPGYPYERFGRAQFRPDDDRPETRVYTSQPSSQPSDQAQEQSGPRQTLPRTRFRFGAVLDGNPPRPPNPTVPGGQSDPVRTGLEAWRATKDAGRLVIGQYAKPNSMTGATAAIPSLTAHTPPASRQAQPPANLVSFLRNRALFDDIGKRMNTNPDFLMALSALESGWLGAHSRNLHNLFGTTRHAGLMFPMAASRRQEITG